MAISSISSLGAGSWGLATTSPIGAAIPSLRDEGGSLILTYWPSEFSQIRTQYRYTHFGEGRTANELLFQFLFANRRGTARTLSSHGKGIHENASKFVRRLLGLL